MVAWWNEAVAEDRPIGEGQPAIVKVEPGPRYFEVKVSAVRDPQRRFVGWLVIIHDISTAAATKPSATRSSGGCRSSRRARA